MKRREIEKRLDEIWRKHSTTNRNMIVTIMPHTNYPGYLKDVVDYVEELLHGDLGKDEEQ